MMQNVLFFLVSIMIMLSFLMLMQTRILNLVKLLILQNIMLSIYIVCKNPRLSTFELFLSLLITFIIKVIVLPWLLWKLVDFLKLSHRIELLPNKSTILGIGILLVIFSLLLSHQIETVVGQSAIISFSLALANTLIAMLFIVVRHKAISQVIGLLVLENSIFLLATSLTSGFPWLIELGMSFDILIGFMIFALFLTRIQITHGSLSTEHLEHLRERI